MNDIVYILKYLNIPHTVTPNYINGSIIKLYRHTDHYNAFSEHWRSDDLGGEDLLSAIVYAHTRYEARYGPNWKDII